ncbi:Calx-beta domain-containing protein [Candidatus Poriferisodalis sp.]|uniref:Calx-beta domain-containing protein n=1 Tax=Candidatus Poriferisodalis sp. TaxID=3101277 RepID=UPI003B014D53
MIGLLLLLAWPLQSAAAQTPPSESDIEDARRLGALHSSLPPLSRHFFGIVDFGDVRLVCPEAVVEGDGTLVFTVRSTESAPQADVRVDYALAPGSAGAASDYSDVSGTLMIPVGARHATVSVSLVDDAEAEGNESFSLLLSDPVGATLVDASAAVAVGCETFAVPHRRGRAGHRAL